MSIVIKQQKKKLCDDIKFFQVTTLDRVDRECSGRDLWLGVSHVKKEEKSIPLRVGGEFLVAGSKSEEKGVMHALRESVAPHQDTFFAFLA